jgi:pimeloyl-ACP methyl ester carboxylesterase
MLALINAGAFTFINSNFDFLIRALTRFGIRKRKLTSKENKVYKSMFRSKSVRRTSTYLLHQLLIEEDLLRQIQTAFETTFNKIPALIIYGEKDPLTEMNVPQRIHSMLPNSELYIIKGEGHFPHEGAPGEMNDIIRTWLNGKLTA